MILVDEAFKPTKNEIAMAREMAKYPNKWIAIVTKRGREKIVASGDRITDAIAEAEKLGIKNPAFRKVPAHLFVQNGDTSVDFSPQIKMSERDALFYRGNFEIEREPTEELRKLANRYKEKYG